MIYNIGNHTYSHKLKIQPDKNGIQSKRNSGLLKGENRGN